MSTDTATAYLRTQVLTAPPEQLRLMLLEGAIKFARQGRDAIDRKDYEGIYLGFSRARNIVMELMNSVGPGVDPALKANIEAVYMFIYTQLVDAGFERDGAKADKALERLEYERETWVMAIEKARAERGAAGPGQAPQNGPPTAISAPALRPGAPIGSPLAAGAGRPALSVQG
jgi:flagellar protein FliS